MSSTSHTTTRLSRLQVCDPTIFCNTIVEYDNEGNLIKNKEDIQETEAAETEAAEDIYNILEKVLKKS